MQEATTSVRLPAHRKRDELAQFRRDRQSWQERLDRLTLDATARSQRSRHATRIRNRIRSRSRSHPLGSIAPIQRRAALDLTNTIRFGRVRSCASRSTCSGTHREFCRRRRGVRRRRQFVLPSDARNTRRGPRPGNARRRATTPDVRRREMRFLCSNVLGANTSSYTVRVRRASSPKGAGRE
jgi:hypothetical protein